MFVVFFSVAIGNLFISYRDEAARMWQKRDAEWERERMARERLMTEVCLFNRVKRLRLKD